jgi:hypothetical protein
MTYIKSKEYIETVYNFLEVLYKKAKNLQDEKLIHICKLIFNYLISCCAELKVLIRDLEKNENFNMKPINDYIVNNNIQLLDFNNLKEEDINIKDEKDIERFVLTHILYIYQNNK